MSIKRGLKSFHPKNLKTPSLKKGGIFMLGITVMFAMLLAIRANVHDKEKDKDLDAPYVSTPYHVVDKMLDMADVGPGDYVIDPGCGDGRLVIEAARRGATGKGIDLDPERIKEARRNALVAGVSDRVTFVQEDIFETDYSKANVVTMYLLSSLNKKLRPILLDQLEPGARIVSHNFDMGEWEADKYINMSLAGKMTANLPDFNTLQANNQSLPGINPLGHTSEFMPDIKASGKDPQIPLEINVTGDQLLNLISSQGVFLGGHGVYYWVVPADIEGQWQWQLNDKEFSMEVAQDFQEINLQVQSDNRSLVTRNASLEGDSLRFKAFNPDTEVDFVFQGHAEENRIEGKVRIHHRNNTTMTKNWSAQHP